MRRPGGQEVALDLLAGGVPCPPFSVAGKMLGVNDPRNLFGQMIRLAKEAEPKAIMIENVRGLLSPEFDQYRHEIESAFIDLGFKSHGFRLIHASDHGVPQLRPRVIFVGLKSPFDANFEWPSGVTAAKTVGESLFDLMSENGWDGAKEWAEKANAIAPTLVGGSKLHGGPDLGPTRARAAWAMLGVDGGLIAAEAPKRGFVGMPNLTVAMAANIQGFERDWKIAGSKTHAYRQVGNAFPPPVARAIGVAIRTALIQNEG
jgi:DNA (cytosine-5)-methyltransferase 1